MKSILDVACGGKMFYFDKQDSRVLFCDKRKIKTELCDGREYEVNPDIVLEPNGVLIFKWNETDIKVSEILKLTDQKPVFGHKSGKLNKTHWICFMKGAE